MNAITQVMPGRPIERSGGARTPGGRARFRDRLVTPGAHVDLALPRLGVVGLFVAVVGAALALVVALVGLDVMVASTSSSAVAAGLRGPSLVVALESLAEVQAAILGLSLTVAAIVVQLASQRYSAKVVELFMRDPTNALVFGLMTVSCVYVVVLPVLAPVGEPPPVAIFAALGLTVINFGLLLPYFRYVFAFIRPDNIIMLIERAALRALDDARARRGGPAALASARRTVATAIERIADNCLAALAQEDRNLALHTVRTLGRLVCTHAARKRELPPAWAAIEASAFASLSEGFHEEIVAQGLWVEAKALLEFEHIIRRAIGGMDELVSQIASSTRAIGVEAAGRGDVEVTRTAIRFFNTFIRHGLNAGNVRAIYNVLEHYRRLAVALLGRYPGLSVQIAEHLLYYADRANAAGVPFVTETIAHDIRVLCQAAYEAEGVDAGPLVERFLALDQRPQRASDERALIGVRKAQALFGAFLLERGELGLVAAIRDDMREESPRRLTEIRDAILAVDEARFWEITDRGFNFDYVEPGRRGIVAGFFGPLIGESVDCAECQPARGPFGEATGEPDASALLC